MLAPYNPEWPKLFEAEKIDLQRALGDIACHIEHIGSTAIPGIYAKPVIDIMVGIDASGKFSRQIIENIEALGYCYQPAFEAEFPNRRYFQKNDNDGNRTHQIHLVHYPSAWWEKHILFRDYLRTYPDVAKEYELHKLMLAKKFTDTIPYAAAKTVFCQNVDKQAYFDFQIHKPNVSTTHLNGYIPQPICFDIYRTMFQEPDFVRCFGVELDDEKIKAILHRDTAYWDRYQFGPFVWFDKESYKFVGEGGLNHTTVDGQEEIELTYSLSNDFWGKGLAAEIGQYAIHDAFQRLHLKNIVCFTMTTNQRSLRVMEKLGFQYEKDFLHYGLPHKLYRLYNL